MTEISVYARRGGPAGGPENTQAEFQAAFAAVGVEVSADIANHPRDVRRLAALGARAI